MFTSIKNLTAYIDKNIRYVEDAKAHHTCSEVEYQDYLYRMAYLLDKQLIRLQSLSTNKKLIENYKNRVHRLFQ